MSDHKATGGLSLLLYQHGKTNNSCKFGQKNQQSTVLSGKEQKDRNLVQLHVCVHTAFSQIRNVETEQLFYENSDSLQHNYDGRIY